MDPEAGAPDRAEDEDFLDQAYERAVLLLEEGSDPTPDDLLDGREHLRAEIETLLRTARQAPLVRPRRTPRVPGYALLSELGRGGMGTVWLARQESLGGRLVAVKMLPGALGFSGGVRERFLAEARALAGLRHPGVVPVYDVVAGGDVPAYAMEWIEGASLAGLIDALRRVAPAEPTLAAVRELLPEVGEDAGATWPVFVCRAAVAVARALAALHEAGLVHRDVKPSNVLLRADGTALLSDFGLVHEADATLTRSGEFAGTIAYASPEQLAGGRESLNARSDVYSLGVTLYHALTLHLPFDEPEAPGRRPVTPTVMLRRIESGRAAPLRSWNRRLPRDLETIVAKATDPDPALRYAGAGELADDLERMLSLQPIRARPAGWWSRAAKLLRRNRAAALGLAAGSVVSLAAAATAAAWFLLVPRWVEEHVREARLILLDPGQANAVFNAVYWGRPGGLGPRAAALREARRRYDAALRWTPADRSVREERAVVASLLDPPGRAGGPSGARAEGLSSYLTGDVARALDRLGALEGGVLSPEGSDPLVEAALGILHLVQDDAPRAYPRLREACRMLPDVGFLTTYLADAAVRCRDFAVAERLLAAAAGMDRLDPEGALDRVRAELLAGTGRPAEAEALFRGSGTRGLMSLAYARFLEARGRREEAVDEYVRTAAVLSGERVRSECVRSLDRWWASLPALGRLRRIWEALDLPSDQPRSLVARLRTRGLGRERGAASGSRSRFFATLVGRFPSPSLQNVGLDALADILEVENMHRWNQIPHYPLPLKLLQVLAWRSAWPGAASRGIARLREALVARERRAAPGLMLGVLALSAGAGAQVPHFQGLGDLPGGGTYSAAKAVSADGSTVVGHSLSGNSSPTSGSGELSGVGEAFRWRAGTGMVGLGDLPGQLFLSVANGVSADGSAVAGNSSSASACHAVHRWAEGFRWTSSGMTGLGVPPAPNCVSTANGISDDGAIIVGHYRSPNGFDTTLGRWTASAGWQAIVDRASGWGISRDGTWLVGNRLPPGSGNDVAIRWSQATGLQDLGDLPGGAVLGIALAASNAGSVVGYSSSAASGAGGNEAFRWTESTGLAGLGDLPGGIFYSIASGISVEGSIVVGMSNSVLGYEAVIWEQGGPIARVVDFLATHGVEAPPCWKLESANAVSLHEGVLTLCGTGLNPSGQTEAWLARCWLNAPPQATVWRFLAAEAGADVSVAEGVVVALDGTGSISVCAAPQYVWSQVGGTPVVLDLTDPARPTFHAPAVPMGGMTLTFQLLVSDGQHVSPPDVVNVTVKNLNSPPVATAGDDQTVAELSPVTLDGSNSYDPDNEPLTFTWTQTAGPAVTLDLDDPRKPEFLAPFVGPAGATLTFELRVGDGLDVAIDSVSVMVENVNHPPVADAGPDQTVAEGAAVALGAGASGDPDGDPLTFAWTQTGGPAVTLTGAGAAAAGFTAPAVGPGGAVLVFQVTVDDGWGGSAFDEVRITVQDAGAPPACAGARPSVSELWPPNHKMVPVRILGLGSAAITILGVTQDEPVSGLGDGDTGPDAVIQGGTVLVRAERSGTGNGRVYRIAFQATDGSSSCTGLVRVVVPHGQGRHAPPPVDDGLVFNSTGP
jgi:serine/threonine protein kinase/uncharacterized membrane protein